MDVNRVHNGPVISRWEINVFLFYCINFTLKLYFVSFAADCIETVNLAMR